MKIKRVLWVKLNRVKSSNGKGTDAPRLRKTVWYAPRNTNQTTTSPLLTFLTNRKESNMCSKYWNLNTKVKCPNCDKFFDLGAGIIDGKVERVFILQNFG